MSRATCTASRTQLSESDYQHCCVERGLNREWVEASCQTLTMSQATEYLGYPASSGGILIEGANGQYQYRPHKPWSNKPGQKAPKYRTAAGDEYDALLPVHPTDPYYWNNIEALKKECYSINGTPMIIVTEGGFKAIALCSHGHPAIALLGVEMGQTSSKDDPQGKRYLVPELERFAKLNFGFIFAFDADIYRKKPVKQALIKLARALQKYNVPVYTLPEWDERDGKGVDDYIQQNGIEEFRQQLLSQAVSFDEWHSEYGDDAFDKKPPKPDIIGAEIAERYRDRWIYCDELKTWLTYSLETEGIWTIVSRQYLAAEIHAILKARNIQGYGTNAYIQNILGALERELFIRKWNERSSTDWLPFQNGVLELATNKLHDHSPGFRFTWQLPRQYSIIETGWQSIDNWLDEATQGNKEHKQMLLCFAAAVLRGRNDLQKFLHLIGGGGSGKSTFTTLLTALVGESNTATMNLSELEDKHEIARIFGKRLVVLPDQDKAPRKMSNFKRLTGQDRLSGRRLFENGFEYVFGGLTVVTSNFPIFHTNLGSWLTRRVQMIPFDYQCPNHKKRDLMKDFESELGAFTSYLLSIPETEIEAVLKGVSDRSLSSTVWESQIRSDGLAAWVNEWVIEDSTGSVAIGSNAQEWKVGEDYEAVHSTLYGSYSLYCQQTKRSAKSPQNFSAELIELTNRTLGWLTEKARVTIGGKRARVIKGLKLRSLSGSDRELTVEEILTQKQEEQRQDNLEDNYGTTLGTTVEPPSDKERDNLDNLFENKTENKARPALAEETSASFLARNNLKDADKLSSIATPPSTVIDDEDKQNLDIILSSTEDVSDKAEVTRSSASVDKDKNLINKSALVVPVVPTQTEQRIEAVPQVVPTVVPQAVPSEINWKTYPYNSSDRYTLKNRADKVKDRLLGCATSNELNKLIFLGKVTEIELNWLVQNYLTIAERKHLENTQNSTQGNLFSTSSSSEVIELEFGEIIEAIDKEMKRLGWSVEQGRNYISDRYGEKSRRNLSDRELVEFWEYLKEQKEE